MTDETPTIPQRPITLIELRDAILARLEENDHRSSARHRMIVDEIAQIRATLRRHEERLGELERGSSASLARPLWVAVLLLAFIFARELFHV